MYKLTQAIMTFVTSNEELASPRLVLQYEDDTTGDFKQVVAEQGSDFSNTHQLDQYFNLIKTFGNNPELVQAVTGAAKNETIQFVNTETTGE